LDLNLLLILLVAGLFFVPLVKVSGFGTILGYLAAGIVIGPGGLGLITDVAAVQPVADFGVVLFLFVIGLELQPIRLWAMRTAVFGVGLVQLAATAALLAAIAAIVGLPPAQAIAIGLILALSSTPVGLQVLAERGELQTKHGRSAFGVLLFQDVAAIPLIALLPLLGTGAAASGGEPWYLAAGKALGAIALLLVLGRYALRFGFRLIARTHVREAFTAAALVTVGAAAWLMQAAGLSMGLGAFLAGVLLADSEFRHEIEADIDPFKGLLLGLFFMAVGMTVDPGLIAERPAEVIALVLALLLAKAAVLFAVGRAFGLANRGASILALSISQGGEFGFVLLGVGLGAAVFAPPLVDLLVLVITLSIAMTPLVMKISDWWQASAQLEKRAFDSMPDDENAVIIAGFGRVGQIAGRILRAKRIAFTAIDINPEHIDFVVRFGNKVYYGDASRLDILRAARVDRAKVLVLAIDDVEASLRTAELVRRHFPAVEIFARARNRQHVGKLWALGIRHIWRETFLSSLALAEGMLRGLGLDATEARRAVEMFRAHDEQTLAKQYEIGLEDWEKIIANSANFTRELEELFDKDAQASPPAPERPAQRSAANEALADAEQRAERERE
jgi:glutathione-regulated potassium-efflux system protein KefB